ncbi:UNVERIFIED_CONTAM: hypothetical protein Scaly_2663800 [Sesamum calycinum]|uniref:Uncharacterized protein n=1 Tax=Sesamum calycinum TaxID=2727403 RepID=A0AAW2J7Z9_9LAMI
MYYICMKGFMDGYYNWTAHGEAQVLDNYDDQLVPVCSETPIAPNMRTQWDRLFDVVHMSNRPLYNRCDQSHLTVVARLVNNKAGHMSERCYDQVSQWASDLLPHDHTFPSNYCSTKKMIRDLGLPIKKIHACKNGCMLYYKDNIDMEYCKFYGDPRYKPTWDRNSLPTAEHMTWHTNHVMEESSMCHPSNAKAWRHFDRTHPKFALEPPNLRLGLCIDGFAFHGQYD